MIVIQKIFDGSDKQKRSVREEGSTDSSARPSRTNQQNQKIQYQRLDFN